MCVFFTQTPIQESLILYNDPEINELSIQCFTSECTHNNTWYYTLKLFFLFFFHPRICLFFQT